MWKVEKSDKLYLPLLGLLGLLFAFISYSGDRTAHLSLGLCFLGMALLYFILAKWVSGSLPWKHLLWGAIFIRLIPLFALPPLSDDVYRFIWDGALTLAQINPFSYTPETLVAGDMVSEAMRSELFPLLNSPEYYSVYPPVHQWVFLGAAFFWQQGGLLGSIIFIRLLMIGGEIGLLFALKKLLFLHMKKESLLVWYAFNPLVLLEISLNLHFEGLMLLFIAWFWILLIQKQFYPAAGMLGLAVATKLLPILLLPLVWRRSGLTPFFISTGIVLAVLFIGFLPFIEWQGLSGMGDSLSLYFQKFEFNASIYYLFREIGYWWKGYNMISQIGVLLPIMSISAMIFVCWKDRQKLQSLATPALYIWTIYLIFSTTVHPWYVIPLVFFAIFSGHIYPILWSILVLSSYFGYTSAGYAEPWIWLVGSYSIVFLVLIVSRLRNKYIL